jgi:hypothetical protein
MPYTKTVWKEDGTTPLTATRLNNAETQYEKALADIGLIESGSNASGSYVKLPDGTLICYVVKEFDGQGVAFFNNGAGTSTPFAFVGDFVVNVTAFNLYNTTNVNGTAETYGSPNGNNSFRWGVKFPSAIPVGNTVRVSIMMVGKWK